jgi:Glycosyl hydrolase family 12
MFGLTRFLALPAALLAAGGVIAAGPPAVAATAPSPAAASAAAATLCDFQTSLVGGDAYTVQNNEWGSSAPECISTDGGTDFTVANSSIANPTDSYPGGYPSIYKGCHWGACTFGSGLPIRASAIKAGTVTTSWGTSQPGGGNDYDVAYDIWFNQTPTTSGQPNGTELMIWLNHHGPVQPFGSQVATDVSLGGRSYNVWYGRQTWDEVAYTLTAGTTSVSNLDLQPLVADAIARGYLSRSWYLIDVEAGFEVWNGGAGLATNSFSLHAAGGGGPWPSPIPVHHRGPAPGRYVAAAISLARIIVAIRQVPARLTRRGYDEREHGGQAGRPRQAERTRPRQRGRRQSLQVGGPVQHHPRDDDGDDRRVDRHRVDAGDLPRHRP